MEFANIKYMNKTGFFVISGNRDIKTEIIRKSIHLLIAFCPVMAAINKSFTVGVLAAGIFLYAVFEILRLLGIKVPVVSILTAVASRPRDRGHFVMGPMTLGLGALFSFLFFQPLATAVGIYALAFGDSIASLTGKLFGRNRPAFLQGKSIEGSLACFIAVYFAALMASGDFKISIIAAITASLTEALPLEDFDNLCMPLTVGLAVTALL
ncbi:MAG: phosphatidate cytidylyltransferase [Treponema sp.]|jgi:dolichol kinase|nr:phosphatidate cytidylyltransferase [Treponema sp.]